MLQCTEYNLSYSRIEVRGKINCPFKIQKQHVQVSLKNFDVLSHFNSDTSGHTKNHLPVSCQDWFGASNLVQSVEEDWGHK